MNQAKLQSVALLIGRVGLGTVILYYGLQKSLGLFGGHGIQGTIEFMQSHYQVSQPFAILAICAETLGSLGLILGLFTRVAAFGLMCAMSVASYVAWSKPDFFHQIMSGNGMAMNGAAYPFVNSLFALTFILTGAGDFSLDKALFGKRRRKSA